MNFWFGCEFMKTANFELNNFFSIFNELIYGKNPPSGLQILEEKKQGKKSTKFHLIQIIIDPRQRDVHIFYLTTVFKKIKYNDHFCLR